GRVQELEEHTMEEEHFAMDEELPETIRRVKESGRRLVAVGTTATRAIEGFFSEKYRSGGPSANGLIRGRTDLFIYPGYRFRVVDVLITNFHLPGSTPLMLTAALSGRRNLMEIYSHAVSKEYRFFSYGDAMLVL
ncbi:MAG TPA: S-adenosylmethionine:tRNA ribosyltransferase-isomerase, partial [Thermodesulfovibrionales bacterium]|nr:S-adenosylmethionine:tRNA ribosyltransferase-isomerase [Thermodesulfovibrionales bacterium]